MNERRFGILIANSRFPKEPKLENLRYPENDVDELQKVLESSDHGCFTDTIVFKEDTHYEILYSVNQVLRKADKNDLVLIYYSGHGKLNPAGRLHLATANTILNALESTSISVGTLKDYADISHSTKVILLLDCCFGGAAGEEFIRSGVDDQLQLVSGGRGTYIMTASTGIQVAKEKEADRHGIFTKHIIEGIRGSGADLNCDGEITMDELYRYVHDRVLDEGPQEPMKWDLNVRGELVIARSAKSSREERMREIRNVLLDLCKEGLPDHIFDKARKILSLPSDKITGNLCEYDALLDRLKSESINSLEFVDQWNRIEKKESRKQVDFETKKPSSDKHDETEITKPETKPKIPDPSKSLQTGKVKTADPFPKKVQGKSKSKTEKRKRLIFTIIALVFFLGGVLVYLLIEKNSRMTILKEKNEIFKTQLSKYSKEIFQLTQKLEKAQTLQQIISVQKGKDAIFKKTVGIERETRSNEILSKVKNIIIKLSELQRKIRAKETFFRKSSAKPIDNAPVSTQPAGLFVVTDPKDARIRLLNIVPKFYQGIELNPDRYNIEVSLEGYKTRNFWIPLEEAQDKRILVRLEKEEGKTAQTAAESPVLPKTLRNDLDMKFVLLLSGTFMMGSHLDEPGRGNNEILHQVTLTKAFYMQTTEVTQGQWEEVMTDNPSQFKICGRDCPVEKVSWYDVQDFIEKLNRKDPLYDYRLPTEAEWEYAARAGTDTPFAFGGCLSTDQANYNGTQHMPRCAYGENRKETVLVKSFPPNNWGLYEMHGNVWEWCQDWFGDYPLGPVTDPEGPSSGTARVIRGGSWFNFDMNCRSADRGYTLPVNSTNEFGFRLVLRPGKG